MKAKVDTSWDVMKYKYHYELQHQWDLKKRFIEAHKSKYPEDRLVCLAQLFCNVHFMGCSYEENVMKLIKELSEGIAETNSKWQKQSFVAASDAVEARVKDRLNAPQRGGQQSRQGNQQNFNHQEGVQSNAHSMKSKFLNFVQSIDREPSDANRKRPGSPVAEQYFENKRLKSLSDRQIRQEIDLVVDGGPFGSVVVFQSASTTESPVAIMERTASAAHMPLDYSIIPTNADNVTCKISLDGMFLSSGSGVGRKMAKDAASKLAIERLKETSFTIIVKTGFIKGGPEVDRGLNPPSANAATSSNNTLLDDNIGNRMLKMMGWGGGGLGKDSQGIAEPVVASGTVNREGLGLNKGDFSKKIHSLLQDFIANSDSKELVFSTDFSKDERKFIHESCRRYHGLMTKSYGKDSNRQLAVSKKSKPLEIVEDLLKAGWETEKYKLIPPKSVLERFTE